MLSRTKKKKAIGQRKRGIISDIDFDEPMEVSTEALQSIAALAFQQLELEQRIKKGNTLLKELNQQRMKIAEIDLPEAMAAIHIAEFALETGQGIKVTEKLYASIPKKNKPEAIKWLIKHKQSALVSTNIVLMFDKGEQAKVNMMLKRLEKYNPVVDESVNTGSVKSMIKEMTRNTDTPIDVPLELFGAFWKKTAEIK